MSVQHKCLFILSTKSAGSSVLQETIFRKSRFRIAKGSRHFENETLYWTKASSVLGLNQISLPMSEVPIPARRALRELRELLLANGVALPEGPLDEQAFFAGFRDLAFALDGHLLEKSPHHLYDREVLHMMERFADACDDIDVVFIGLVRNPLDTLYSSWRRFGLPPAMEEPFWRGAYENLRALSERRPDQVRLLRYEDLVMGRADVAAVLGDLDVLSEPDLRPPMLHSRSISKWRTDPAFSHVLSPDTIALARRFGYEEAELTGQAGSWGVKNRVRHLAYEALRHTPAPLRQRISAVRRGRARK